MKTQSPEAVCKHRWIIEPPRGPTSWGECRICHARKEFSNYPIYKGQIPVTKHIHNLDNADCRRYRGLPVNHGLRF